MKPSLQPRKQSLQPNKEADETIRKLHKKDVKFINRYLEKIRFFVNKLEKSFNSRFNSVNKEEIRCPENGVNRNYGNEYDKEQLRENLIRLEEKFRIGQIGEEDYRATKEKYQSMLYEYEHIRVEAKSFKHEDYNYSSELSFFGFFMGGWIGYLLRPAILGRQLSIQQILDLVSNSEDSIVFGENLLKSMAYTSIEYIITGAILGVVVGWVVGKLIKR